MQAITAREDCSIVFKQYVSYVRGSVLLHTKKVNIVTPRLLPAYHHEPASTGPRVVLFRMLVKEQLVVPRSGKSRSA